MDANPEIAARLDRRLDALGLEPDQVDQRVGLPPGTTNALREGTCRLPRGRFLRGLCAALDTDEEYLLGLEPGDLIPAELLIEPQGELGLLSPDEEALLQHYRSLSVPVRAAVSLILATASGTLKEQTETSSLPVAETVPKKRSSPARQARPVSLFD